MATKKPSDLKEGDAIDLSDVYFALKKMGIDVSESDIIAAENEYAVVESVADEGRSVVIYTDQANVSVPKDLDIPLA